MPISIVTSDVYWNEWTDVDFGITSWTHRPLAMMVMDLAFRTGQSWNETHQADPEFDKLLDEAMEEALAKCMALRSSTANSDVYAALDSLDRLEPLLFFAALEKE